MAYPLAHRDVRQRFDSLEQKAYLALWRTYDRLRMLEDEFFSGFALTAQQYNLLRLLRAAKKPVPTLVLAERLVSRAPDITRMLDRLEARGLLTRTRSKTDRRAVLVELTEPARDLMAQMQREHTELNESLLQAVAPGDREAVARGLGAISAHLETLVTNAAAADAGSRDGGAG